MKPYFYVMSLIFLALLSSCTNDRFDNQVDAKEISDYLENYEIENQVYLKIRHHGFSKDFLLYGTFIPLLTSPNGFSLRGRIVRFKLAPDRVILLESLRGYSLAPGDDSGLLLAEFPKVYQDADGVVIDFARGMNNAFTVRNVHSQGAFDKESGTSDQFKSVVLSASFIKSIGVDKDVLTIRQVARWRNKESELISAEFRYYFREYSETNDFKKQLLRKNRWVRYFSTPPMIEGFTSSPKAYITRWDITQPIIFYLSDNVPNKYRRAIIDGLTFWNHIFGKEIVSVRNLTEGKSAPDPRLNILQWVSFDNEASAYADMVVDPLNGRILQAQIYVLSGWVAQSPNKLRNALEELFLLKEADEDSEEEEIPLPSVFGTEIRCIKSITNFAETAELIASLGHEDISDEILPVLTNDLLRTVIAHEMGHVLGLRHNLAGSTEGSMSLDERRRLLKIYLQTGEYSGDDDQFLSRSMMDVFSAVDDALVGAQIRKLMNDNVSKSRLREIYDYDRQALDFGYLQKPMERNWAFCTDEDMEIYQDCLRWDVSSTPLSFASYRLNNAFNQMAVMLGDTFFLTMDRDPKNYMTALFDISLTNEAVVKIFGEYTKDLFQWFNEKARSVHIESKFPAFGLHNKKTITGVRFKSQRDQILTKGVEDSLFALLPPFRKDHLTSDHLADVFAKHLMKRFDRLQKKRPNIHVTHDELALAKSIARDFFDHINNEIIRATIMVIARAKFDDPNFQLPIEEALGKIAEEVILAHKLIRDGAHADRALPRFTFDLKTRDAASQLLNPSLGLLPDWCFDNLRRVSDRIKDLAAQCGLNEKVFDTHAYSRKERQWMIEQGHLINALNNIQSITRPLNPPPPTGLSSSR